MMYNVHNIETGVPNGYKPTSILFIIHDFKTCTEYRYIICDFFNIFEAYPQNFVNIQFYMTLCHNIFLYINQTTKVHIDYVSFRRHNTKESIPDMPYISSVNYEQNTIFCAS